MKTFSLEVPATMQGDTERLLSRERMIVGEIYEGANGVSYVVAAKVSVANEVRNNRIVRWAYNVNPCGDTFGS